MIQVLSKKALQFRNPDKALINKKATLGQPNQINTTKLEEAFCRVPPNVVTRVPDWVKTDPIFDWSVADGDLMEIVVNPGAPAKGVNLQSQGQQQVNDQKTKDEEAEAAKEKAALHEKLAAMNKQQLIDYAAENHDLELGAALKKEDILAAIHEAEAEKEKETAA
jgi:hypothetical protein